MIRARKRLLRFRPLRYQEITFEVPVTLSPEDQEELNDLGYHGMVELKFVHTLRPFRTYRKYAKNYRYAVLLPVDYDGYMTWYTYVGDRHD